MQKYETVNKLSAIEFRRLTGVQKETFVEMVLIIKEAECKRMSRGGKPPHLGIEDRVLMTLEYLREYRTYFHLGQSYGLSESACYRNCRWIEDVLIKRGSCKTEGFVDFRDYFGRFSVFFQGVIYAMLILPPEKERKIGSKEPENRQNLSFATPSRIKPLRYQRKKFL